MLVAAVRAIALQIPIISGILGTLALVIWLAEDGAAALAFLRVTFVNMQALFVWPLGWGLATFVRREALGFGNDVRAVFIDSPAMARFLALLERSRSHRKAWWLTAPVTSLGLVLSVAYEVPLTGMGKTLVTLGLCTIYYVAAYLLWHFIFVVRAFAALQEASDTIEFGSVVSPVHLDRAMSYVTIATAVGVLAIYIGFRGTLTAGFTFRNEEVRPLLLTPLVLFLPATLFFNFYPSHVLRKLVQYRVFAAMNRLARASRREAGELVLDIRELGLTHAQILPFLDYKNLPSFLISILFVTSLAYHNDPTVRGFIAQLLGIGPE